MSEQELEALKAELEKVKAELKKEQENNNLDEIRAKYEKVIEDKNKEINELSKTNQAIQERMDNTVSNLNDEVKLKLEQSEQLIELNKQVEELLHDKAEATVDKYITEGKILPAQKETALKLCLKDNDTFMDLYKDAKPIIDTSSKPQTKKVNTDLNRLVDYFKN
jgi:FKBP-type peptidyl-prolyl cis-trans isomerase (trigger factor)